MTDSLQLHDSPDTSDRDKPRRRRRRWLLRGLAILVGLLPLLLVELLLQLLQWPMALERNDPLIGFQEDVRLFEPDGTGIYRTGEVRREFFRPEQFSVRKASDEFRIFCLGGSTVQGRPYQIETSFTTWLELSLQAAEPTRSWQVVNCGGVSYASYRLLPILDEVLEYEPDLIILCTGHNEFLEDRTYAHVRQLPAWQQTAHRWASFSKLYQALRLLGMSVRGVQIGGGQRELLAGEVQARLDFEGGLELFVRDNFWREMVVRHYAENLERMVWRCREAGVPVVLMNPCENLRDCGPFKSLPGPSVAPAVTEEVQRLLQESATLAEREPRQAIEGLQRARRLDPQYALTHYRLGQLFEQQQEFELAKQCYQRARDEDICPLRMLGSMHTELFEVAARWQVPCVDVQRLFELRSPQEITDDTWLLDHVHPSIEGHRLIADALFEQLVQQAVVSPQGDWQTRREKLYETHRDSLSFAYFEHGRQRLEGLRQWTRGQAYGALPEDAKIPVRRESHD